MNETTLKTRKPTGAVPWPLILIEGGEKSGKSYSCAVLSASPKVGRTLWLDLNEGAADEYGAVPGARYEVIEHDGTWQSILGQVGAVKVEAARARDAGELPVVLVIDSMTAEWDLLKSWTEGRAKLTDSNKAKLAKDPNTEINISMNFWNDANTRHRRLMTMLMTFPGIVVMAARGKDVAALDEKGRPIEGSKEYRVEGNKNLGFDASCWVRMYRDKPAVVIGARSVHTGVRPGRDEPQKLNPDWTLEWLIFDALKCDPSGAHVRELAELRAQRTPNQIRDEALETTSDFEHIKELWAEAKELGYDDAKVIGDTGEEERLLDMLFRVGSERGGKPAQPATRKPATAPAAASQPAPARQPERPRAVPDAADADDDAGWVREFTLRLGETADEVGIRARRSEVAKAAAAKTITPATANELLTDINRRKGEMAGAAA